MPWRGLLGRAMAIAVMGLAAGGAEAAPHRPGSDEEVLQRLPAAAQVRALSARRADLASDPSRVDAALDLARQYLDVGRRTDDPRLVAYAISVLEPWTRADSRSSDALVIAASAEQYLHRFGVAIDKLDRALALEPRHPQALLVRANLLEVQGDLAAAKSACARLAGVTAQVVAITCLTSIASRNGDLEHSLSNLQAVRSASPRLPADVEVWLLMTLADMTGRAGEPALQREYLDAARLVAPDDLKVKAAMADWLLTNGQPRQVLELLADDEQHDALLLRLAIAAKVAGDERRERYARAFRERAALAAGERLHLRETARFVLEVEEDPKRAAAIAAENWMIQREPEDLRLLHRAAKLGGDAAALKEATAWIDAHHYEDRQLR